MKEAASCRQQQWLQVRIIVAGILLGRNLGGHGRTGGPRKPLVAGFPG
ncbi:MAG TPA: hypothetical protein VFX20_02355 [Steroidobacteraceae bacterium]|nr:hypothetical protein [Steroidobacteraceae bacterium]